jgi:hypothetical protein
MIRYPEIESAVTPKAAVHAAKRKPGKYLDLDARRAYRREWMARQRGRLSGKFAGFRYP